MSAIAAAFALTLAFQPTAFAQTAPVTIGIEGVVALSSRQQVSTLLMAAGLTEDQVRAEPLLVKLPDLASRQNVTARFMFVDDRLTELLFTLTSDDTSELKAQVDRWGGALRSAWGSKRVEASTSPEGYQLEGWCIAPGVEVSTVSKGTLAALDYVVDEFGPCREAPAATATPGSNAFMYRLPANRPG